MRLLIPKHFFRLLQPISLFEHGRPIGISITKNVVCVGFLVVIETRNPAIHTSYLRHVVAMPVDIILIKQIVFAPSKAKSSTGLGAQIPNHSLVRYTLAASSLSSLLANPIAILVLFGPHHILVFANVVSKGCSIH